MVATPWQIIAAMESVKKINVESLSINAHTKFAILYIYLYNCAYIKFVLFNEKDTYKPVCRRKHRYTAHESEHFDTNKTN